MTALHHAANVGCLEVNRILLEHGADATLKTSDDQVPLHLVSERWNNLKDEGERLAVAELLLTGRYGDHTDINAQDFLGATPLHRASQNRRPRIVRLLLAHGANPHAEDAEGRNPLHYLSLARDEVDHQDVLGVTQLLLEQGVDINVQDENHETPLHTSSSYGHLQNVRLLLKLGANVMAKNVHGQIPLHRVSQCQYFSEENVDVTRLLLQQGTDVNSRDKNQATPLHFASFRGHFEISLALLDHGADINARNADGQTPLHRVPMSIESRYSGYNCHRVAELMLERGADVNAPDKFQATPLHFAYFMSNLDIARVLLDHGANIHAKNNQGQTPLHMASHGDYGAASEPALVELLQGRGADVDARDNDQATPFLLASFHLKLEIAEKLFQNGADANAVNIYGQNALHLLAQNQHTDDYQHFGRRLLERGVDMNGRDKDERTPLHFASYSGQVDVAEALLVHGAQVNATDISGHTPLHQVILGISKYDHQNPSLAPWDIKEHPRRVIRLAQRLLESGADVNAQNKEHETPLHLASRLRLHDMARLLLKHGAKVDMMNSKGKTPLQLSTRRKGKAMRRLLSEWCVEHT